MRAGRLFVLLVVAALGAIGIWRASGEGSRAMVLSLARGSPQQKSSQTQAQREALCRKYSQATPLAAKLDARVLAVHGDSRTRQVSHQVRQALPAARIFVDGKLEERASHDVPQYVRETAPADAVLLRVSERPLPEGEPKIGLDMIQELTVLDAAGAVLGRWQGFANGCPSSSRRDPLSLVAFLSSRPAGASAPLPRYPRWQEIRFDVLTAKGRYVARPEDFTDPVSSPLCPATLVRQANARDPALQVRTRAGDLLFKFVKADQTLPAVACSEERAALLFRTPTQVVVMALDRDGYLYAVGRVALNKVAERETFRDVTIEGETVRATLVAFELDRKGTLVAETGRSIVATLGPAPEKAAAGDAPATLGLTRHEACAQPPALPASTEVHELGGVGVSWEYVHVPGQQPRPFRSAVVNAPMRSVALSFPNALGDLVWLVQATQGTDLRYVEISSKGPQTVIFKNPGKAIVNVATDASCPTLFARGSATRNQFNIRAAYSKRGEPEPLAMVLLANGNPFVSAPTTYSAVEAFGFKHLSSLTGYLLQLKAEGAIEDALPEDLQRFRDYYYEGMPLGRKLASWFRQDPAMEIRSRWGGNGYLVKRPFPLPLHPEGTLRETLLLVDKGVALPQGNIGDYLLLDANSLSCPGQQRGCPWSRGQPPR